MTDLPPDAGPILIAIARSAIGQQLDQPAFKQPTPTSALWLSELGASFVTLTTGGQLRGCIGSLTAWRPLGLDVRANAESAAFDDDRFAPVTVQELPRIRIEVSVLSPAQALKCTSRAEAEACLQPGRDGVIFSTDRHRATFLPQVWEQLPEPAAFLDQLIRKAGLPPRYWSEAVRLERYTVTVFTQAGEDA